MRNRFFDVLLLGACMLGLSSVAAAAPTLKMISPVSGTTLSGTQVLETSVQSTATISKVVFYRDNWVAIGTVKTFPYRISFDTATLSSGSHSFFAAAYTTSVSGASNIVKVNIQISATPAPSPSLTPTPAPSPTLTPSPTASPTPVASSPQALKMADFILSLQDAGGAIKDGPGGKICNEDSNMEYAMLGLAAAYVKSKDPRYLTGYEKALDWLAAREDMSDTTWRGSWYYTYSCSAPYDHVANSTDVGITDVRGVDTTSAYFAYLLYIHKRITGSDAMVTKYSLHAKAALDFVLRNNWDPQGMSYSSWQLISGTWKLWPYQYTADQADVYLGMRAGALMFDGADRYYGTLADKLQQNIPALFYDTKKRRYAEGREDGGLDWSNEFDAIFPQGYVPWVLGNNSADLGAYLWMAAKAQTDGSIIAYSGDPKYSLSISIFGMAANSLGQPEPTASYNWLLNNAMDSKTGGVRDTASVNSSQYSNVAAFTILGLLRQSPWDW